MNGSEPHRLSALTTQFSLDVFQSLVKERKERNVIISPVGIASSLAMVLNGATGETARAIAGVLGVEEMLLDRVNMAFRSVLTSLKSMTDGTQVKLGVSLWGRNGVVFRQDFIDQAAANYSGRIEDHTSSTVGFGASDGMSLFSMADFKARWTDPFDVRASEPGTFQMPGGQLKPLNLMNSWGSREYLLDSQVQVVRLPYGSGRVAMLVVLPREDLALADIVYGLSADRLAAWLSGLATHTVALGLPRFTAANNLHLRATLTQLGVVGLGSPWYQAAFDGLAEGANIMWEVIQDTQLTVNEVGAIRAATPTPTSHAAVPGEQAFYMHVTRPFLIAVLDHDTGSILFLGAINNPDNLT